jgi:cysteine-rich repeat protein
MHSWRSLFRISAALFSVFSLSCGGDPPNPTGAGAAGPINRPEDPAPDLSDQVFDPTKLHTIDIEVDLEYLKKLDLDLLDRVPCRVRFDDELFKKIGCRRENGYNSDLPLEGKTGFSLKFTDYNKDSTLRGITRLFLNNSEGDPSFLGEHIGYEVYRRAGIPAPRTGHAIVRFNGVTKGIYVFVEPYNRTFLERNFGEENREGNLYEGPMNTDFALSPGSMDLKDEGEGTRSRDDINELADIVMNTPDADLAAELSPKLDLDVFLKGYAIDALFGHTASYSYGPNDYFMFHNPATDRFVFLPQGMNKLLDESSAKFDVKHQPVGALSTRAQQIPELSAKFDAAVADIIETAWDVPHLLARIDQVTAIVNGSANKDPAALADIEAHNAHVGKVRQIIAYREALLLGEPLRACGNGALELFEDCDDGNQKTGDGCSAACYAESCAGLSFGDGKYLFCPDQHPLEEARLICEAYGGALAVPKDAAENEWMKSVLEGPPNMLCAIGVAFDTQKGAYVAPDGAPVPFFDWLPFQPDDPKDPGCVALAKTGWVDEPCWKPAAAICQVP